jgi:hypothetical protein
VLGLRRWAMDCDAFGMRPFDVFGAIDRHSIWSRCGSRNRGCPATSRPGACCWGSSPKSSSPAMAFSCESVASGNHSRDSSASLARAWRTKDSQPRGMTGPPLYPPSLVAPKAYPPLELAPL